MLHGRVVRPAIADSRPLTVDESSIADIPGIVRVVQEDSFIGIVADTEWSAIQAARKLKVTWSAPETKLPANRDEVFAYLKNTKSYDDQIVADQGNVGTGFAEASKTFEATYRWPFQMHGCLARPAPSRMFERVKLRSGPARKARFELGRKLPAC